ncbi:MAG: glycosyltransferase family 9 protein, partial [Saprospiraceae bacterium]|nr:glycosyltransferase family 9 protein [Saprospiraceae bacterium]
MKKWLIIQTAFIGDVVLATPIIEKIRDHYPEATIDFLLRKGNESLLANHPYLNHVLIWHKKGNKYQSLWQVLKQIRQERYDVVINCQRFGASGLLTALSGAKHTVGFDKNPFSRFFSKRVPHVVGQTHEVDRNLSLMHHLTGSTFVRQALYPTPAEYNK